MDEQPSLFMPRPTTVTVPPDGISQSWIVRELKIEAGQLFTYHGDELGAPRDYVYRGGQFYYTLAGMERIARLFALPIKIQGGVEVAATLSEVPQTPRHARPVRWDLEERS